MGLVERLEHLIIDDGEIAEEEGRNRSVGPVDSTMMARAPGDQERDDVAPARPSRPVVEREQDLGRLAAVERPDRQEVDQAPEQIDLNQRTSRYRKRQSACVQSLSRRTKSSTRGRKAEQPTCD